MEDPLEFAAVSTTEPKNRHNNNNKDRNQTTFNDNTNNNHSWIQCSLIPQITSKIGKKTLKITWSWIRSGRSWRLGVGDPKRIEWWSLQRGVRNMSVVMIQLIFFNGESMIEIRVLSRERGRRWCWTLMSLWGQDGHEIEEREFGGKF